ncbi:MAG: response regulator [Thermodesulfovibrionales bacterium]
MTNTDGCLPFDDHRGVVDTNPSKSVSGRLVKKNPCQSAVMNLRNPVILCVDDEPANCELLENILVANGYEVISAANGKDALLKIKTRKIDLVLLDIIMPEMNGFEVCREIKESKEFMNIPVIMITALTAKGDRIKGIEVGAEEFLSKPFDKTEVLARIKMLLKVKKLEAALAQSEKHYRRIFETSKDGLLILDKPGGNIIDINQAIVDLLGYPREDLLGKKVMDFGILKDAGDFEKVYTRLNNIGFAQYTDVFIETNRGTHVNAEVYFTDESDQIQCNVRDITERKREEKIRLMAMIVESSNEAIIGEALDGVIITWNKGAERCYGYTSEEIKGCSVSVLLPPDYSDDVPQILDKISRGENISNYETLRIRKDGSLIHVSLTVSPVKDATGKIVGASTIAHDITERKESEKALSALEAELRDNYFTQSALNMILSESLENISLEELLQKALNMILSIPGLSFEPIGNVYLVEDEPGILVMKAQSNLSGPVKKLCRHIPFGKCLCGLAAQTRQIQSADHIDERHETCYEGMSPHGHYAVPILFGGRTLGVINIYLKEGVGRNQKEEDFLYSIANTLSGIIVRRQVEYERERLLTQLLQAQKMEAVGQLAGGISHDFNNILTAMIGYGHLLKMKMKDDDPLRTYADNILSLSDKAANLTQSLLAFSRKRIMNPCPANLNEIIVRIDYLLSRIIGEDIHLQTMLSEEDLIVMADSGQIEQVLMNLATNARDAMPEGGFLSIGTEKIAIDNEFITEHGFGNEGEYALISLTDTGVGMDRETREKIFEPFFTTKEVGKGTGLGLSMVYGIIKQHEGFINVYSEPGMGTTFRIYLPLIEAKVEQIKPEAIQPIETGTETVLLAEDEETIREFIKKLLEEYGYKVITAVDGQTAINEFKAHQDKIQLMLLDVIMPNRNGKEAYDEIKKIRPDIKVLFMSGYPADIIHKQDIIEKGFAYVEKPASPTKLLRKIREVLGK